MCNVLQVGWIFKGLNFWGGSIDLEKKISLKILWAIFNVVYWIWKVHAGLAFVYVVVVMYLYSKNVDI
jgi:hypothetical protein